MGWILKPKYPAVFKILSFHLNCSTNELKNEKLNLNLLKRSICDLYKTRKYFKTNIDTEDY
jgi:hypothetical protein